MQIFGHAVFIKQKVRWHSTVLWKSELFSHVRHNFLISHIKRIVLCHRTFLLDKGRVVENLQKECLCYFIISSTSLWRTHFNHIYKLFELSSKLLVLVSWMRNNFPKRPSGVPLHNLSIFYDVLFGFVTPFCVFVYLQSPKGDCVLTSDDLSCSS